MDEMTTEQIKVLSRLKYGAVPTKTDWDENPITKQAFLELEKTEHIRRIGKNVHGRWHITAIGLESLRKKGD